MWFLFFSHGAAAGAMVDVMDPTRIIKFTPRPVDVPVLEALMKRLGISGPALIRLCLRDKAMALKVWDPSDEDEDPAEPVESGTGDEDQRAAG